MHVHVCATVNAHMHECCMAHILNLSLLTYMYSTIIIIQNACLHGLTATSVRKHMTVHM